MNKKVNLSEYDPSTVPDGHNYRVGIVAAEWNSAITDTLLEGARNTLEKQGVKKEKQQ